MGRQLLVLPALPRRAEPTRFRAHRTPSITGWARQDATVRTSQHPGVDLYVGGPSTPCLHLLYARFWHKVLFDLGYVSTPEPFFKLVNQAHPRRRRPEDVQVPRQRGEPRRHPERIRRRRVSPLRNVHGPARNGEAWNTKGVEGVYRFLGRVWRLFVDEKSETEFEQAGNHHRAAATDPTLLETLIKLRTADRETRQPTPEQLKTLHTASRKSPKIWTACASTPPFPR